MTKRYCLALDLKDDPALIAEYERHHREVWPEILESIRESGIQDMEIYRVGNRLFMVMEVSDGFSFEAKGEADRTDPRVQEWEALMWRYGGFGRLLFRGQGRGRPNGPSGAGVGGVDVEVPGTPPLGRARGEMGPDGADLPVTGDAVG
jgi:L-rhamnose mutarotase